jgi:hypothetical protein
MNKTQTIGITLFIIAQMTFAFPWATGAEKINLAPNPSFEKDLSTIRTNVCVFGGWFPIGVVTTDGTSEISIVKDHARTGEKALRVTPNFKTQKGTLYYSQYNAGEEVREGRKGQGVSGARTLAFRLDQDIVSCDASVWVKKAAQQEITIKAIWYTRRDRVPFIKIAEQEASEPVQQANGWYQYALHALRCHGARQVQIVIETKQDQAFFIDDVEILFKRSPHVDLLVNQLGYETRSKAKGIILQSSTSLSRPPSQFSLINADTLSKVHTGPWQDLGYLPEWDMYHWAGDFSAFHTPGHYVAETVVGKRTYYSPPFEISDELLLAKTGDIACRFFYYQRCGMAIPGFHAACHLDDARLPDGKHKDLTGGWHDAGDYNKYSGYTPESVYALAFAYDQQRDFYDRIDRNQNGRADILDEAIWGAAFLKKCIDPETLEIVSTISSGYGYWGRAEQETDNTPQSGDERAVRQIQPNASACTAGLALLGKYRPEYLDLAQRLYERHGGNMATRLAFCRALPQQESYREAAGKLAATRLQAGTGAFRELTEFALAFPQDPLVPHIKSMGKTRLQEIERLCNNRFGITRRTDVDGRLIYFRHYQEGNNWYVGESRELLDMAYEGVLLDRLGFAQGRVIAENQVHWILGRNPYGVSTMEGVGSVFLPNYHHRYNAIPGNLRGAVPGAVINGITRAWPDHDRPWLDMHPEPNADYQSNEPWLPHNNRWLFLIAVW